MLLKSNTQNKTIKRIRKFLNIWRKWIDLRETKRYRLFLLIVFDGRGSSLSKPKMALKTGIRESNSFHKTSQPKIFASH